MTADLMKEFNQLTNVSTSYGFALIYPGTEMETYAKEKEILPKDFSWNSFYKGEKSKITGEDPSVPYMEWEGKELEKVKSFMVKNLCNSKNFAGRAWKKIKKIRNFSDLKLFIKTGINYLK